MRKTCSGYAATVDDKGPGGHLAEMADAMFCGEKHESADRCRSADAANGPCPQIGDRGPGVAGPGGHELGARGAKGDGKEPRRRNGGRIRSEEHTSELQSLMRISYAVFCLKKQNNERHDK